MSHIDAMRSDVYTPKFHGWQFSLSAFCTRFMRWWHTKGINEMKRITLLRPEQLCYSILQRSSFSARLHSFQRNKRITNAFALVFWNLRKWTLSLLFPFMYWIKYLIYHFCFFSRAASKKKCICLTKAVLAHILFGGNFQENYIYASSISRIDPNEIRWERENGKKNLPS